MRTATPHAGHRARLPARSSRARSRRPHWHFTSIGINSPTEKTVQLAGNSTPEVRYFGAAENYQVRPPRSINGGNENVENGPRRSGLIGVITEEMRIRKKRLLVAQYKLQIVRQTIVFD